jgi:hypothetical protein
VKAMPANRIQHSYLEEVENIKEPKLYNNSKVVTT